MAISSAPVPPGREDGTVTWPLVDVLALQTSEAILICSRGHIAGHPDVCPDGCDLQRTSGTVQDVIGWKPVMADADVRQPVSVEGGWLIDGHHRVRRAIALNLETLPVRVVEGVLATQQSWHQHMRDRAQAGERITRTA